MADYYSVTQKSIRGLIDNYIARKDTSICVYGDKYLDKECLGLQKSEFDDEPIDRCKHCTKYVSYGGED
jgi:hypothetical protein